MTWPFVPGRHYNRRSDIHGRYGGQQQGGIATPIGHSVVFVFTGRGDRHGYSDTWIPDGSLRYFGEGQAGDMRMAGGNRALRDHAANGKDVLLFEKLGSGKPVKFVGQYVVSTWAYETHPDRTGAPRRAIVFDLVPLGGAQSSPEGPDRSEAAPTSLVDLRNRARMAAQAPANTRQGFRTVYQRSEDVRRYVLARADGHCEACGADAPFATTSGAAYLEPHHLLRLSDGGPDHPNFVAATCPNCHRRAHYSADAKVFNNELLKKIAALELAIDQRAAPSGKSR